jgi:hypothetical protein
MDVAEFGRIEAGLEFVAAVCDCRGIFLIWERRGPPRLCGTALVQGGSSPVRKPELRPNVKNSFLTPKT